MTYGLKPFKRDKRDYSHHRTFGTVAVSDIPDEYLLISTILNQGNLPHCTAFSACAARESQIGKPLDTDWFWVQEGIENGSVDESGYDIRIPLKTAVDRGFKPLDGSPINKADSYFSVDGPGDTFDNIKRAMWLGRNDKQCAIVGYMWYNDFIESPDGIVAAKYTKQVGLHASKIAGWTKINGVDYLVLQNSFGTGFGKGGLFFFPRQVVDKEMVEGNFIMRNVPDGVEIQRISLLIQLINKIVNIYKRIIGR